MDKRIINFGVWGFGGHARRSHAKPACKIDHLRLISVCDNNQELKKQCRFYGPNVQFSTDPTALFDSNIEAVIIATPDEFHIAHLRRAIINGKHVLIEKPLAMTPPELDELLLIMTVAKEKGLVITSCHPRRFDPPFVWLKSNLQKLQTELGRVIGFNFDFSYHHPTASWKMDRSLMLDHLNHEIDLVHFLFGIAPFNMTMHCDSYDRYLVTGMRNDGIAMSFHGTRLLVSEKFLEWAIIRFERGEAKINTKTGWAEISHHDCTKHMIRKERCGATNYALRFDRVTRNFADSIIEPHLNYLTPEDLWVNNWLGVTLLKNGTCAFKGNEI